MVINNYEHTILSIPINVLEQEQGQFAHSLVVSCKYWVVPLISTRDSGYSRLVQDGKRLVQYGDPTRCLLYIKKVFFNGSRHILQLTSCKISRDIGMPIQLFLSHHRMVYSGEIELQCYQLRKHWTATVCWEHWNLLSHPGDLRMEAYVIRIKSNQVYCHTET